MRPDLDPRDASDSGRQPRRLYLHEPGWLIAVKAGNDRQFCYMMAPGQDYYHRIYDGEVYLKREDERLCMACAERRGLLASEPRALRQSMSSLETEATDSIGDEIGWAT